MARRYFCDCCTEEIKGARVTGELAPFKDLCDDCYNGFLSIKRIMELTGNKSILAQLDVIKEALHGR